MTPEELLQECKLQLEYLNEKFGETGTTNALLFKINLSLSKSDIESVCEHPYDKQEQDENGRYIKCNKCGYKYD